MDQNHGVLNILRRDRSVTLAKSFSVLPFTDPISEVLSLASLVTNNIIITNNTYITQVCDRENSKKENNCSVWVNRNLISFDLIVVNYSAIRNSCKKKI